MKIIETIKEMQEYSNNLKKLGKSIAVVPTMGFLHEGHLSLIDIAKENADIVVLTNFVNPTQFAPHEDLATYPRDFEQDCKLSESRGVDIVFHPKAEEMYPKDSSTWVEETQLSEGLCSVTRPIFFRGVVTIVTKLFNAVLPDIAVFGQKDAQQCLIIKRMVRDLNFPIKIIIGDIVREADGLAMSSRNKYLTKSERTRALSIYKSLIAAKEEILLGEKNILTIESKIRRSIENENGKIDYIEIRDTKNLSKLNEINGETLIAVAAFFGKTRLIDNIIIEA
jgi:pantoate--beta-alanine ligase